MSASSPIADLSYRNYDGPMEAPNTRWWPIAKMSLRLAVKLKSFWITGSLSAYYYLLLMAVYYFMENFSAQLPGGPAAAFQKVIWKDNFVTGFSTAQLLLAIVALIIGSGAIANDNGANALLVYLSRPLNKFDYLFGKWLAIFILVGSVAFVPAMIFWVYCAVSYNQYGFIHSDPWAPFHILLMSMAAGALHASLCVGVSSMFKQSRLATATYAGIYFIALFFTTMVGAFYMSDVSTQTHTMRDLYYMSVDGLLIGISKILINTDGSSFLPGDRSGTQIVPKPDAALIWFVYFAVCAGAIYVAWRKIKPVEVIGG